MIAGDDGDRPAADVSMAEGLQFRWRCFDELTRDELYEMLALRQEVLVVEQSSPYADLDFIDQRADHLLVTDGSALIGYARCFGPFGGKPFASFGRVVVARSRRREALGKELVRRALARLAQGSCRDVQISAQLYLEVFYSQFGFVRSSKPYDDTGILHIDMRATLREAGFYEHPLF
jgi:ElaA protein